jgi:hypothetical protein
LVAITTVWDCVVEPLPVVYVNGSKVALADNAEGGFPTVGVTPTGWVTVTAEAHSL